MKNRPNMRVIILAIIAFSLLGFYAAVLIDGLITLNDLRGEETREVAQETLSQTGFAAVAGLVSAVVMGALAIRPSKYRLNFRQLFGGGVARDKDIVDWMTWLYVLVWLVLGIAAAVLTLTTPGEKITVDLKWIVEYSKAFLGTVVVAGYAFFSLDPVQDGTTNPALNKFRSNTMPDTNMH